MSVWFFIAALIDANNSGEEVPIAIIKIPVASLLKPNISPNVVDKSVNTSAAFTKAYRLIENIDISKYREPLSPLKKTKRKHIANAIATMVMPLIRLCIKFLALEKHQIIHGLSVIFGIT